MTMTLVSTATVGAGGAASMSFTGIPQDGTDLMLLISIRFASAGFNRAVFMRLNGITTDVYTSRQLQGFGVDGGVNSSTNSAGQGTFVWPSQNQGGSTSANTFASMKIYIPNYASSLVKPVSVTGVTENNANSAIQGLHAGLHNLTTAITSLSIFDDAINMAEHTTASLYKITKF